MGCGNIGHVARDGAILCARPRKTNEHVPHADAVSVITRMATGLWACRRRDMGGVFTCIHPAGSCVVENWAVLPLPVFTSPDDGGASVRPAGDTTLESVAAVSPAGAEILQGRVPGCVCSRGCSRTPARRGKNNPG